MKDKVLEIWPEINLIKDDDLKSKTLDAWVYAIEQSPLKPKDLEDITFSLLIKDCNVSFINHKLMNYITGPFHLQHSHTKM